MGFHRQYQIRTVRGDRRVRKNNGRGRSGCRRLVAPSPVAILLLVLELVVWWNPSLFVSHAFFCHGRGTLPLTSTTTASKAITPRHLGRKSLGGRDAAAESCQRSDHRISLSCVGYFTPKLRTYSGKRSSSNSALFSKHQDGNNSEDQAGESSLDRVTLFPLSLETSPGGSSSNRTREGIFSDFGYGVSCVNRNFLYLYAKVFGDAILWNVPLVVLLFWVLPSWSMSSSTSLQNLSQRIVGALVSTVQTLTRWGIAFFIRPVGIFTAVLKHYTAKWWPVSSLVAWVARVSPGRVWQALSSERSGALFSAIVYGPIVEELYFRWMVRGFCRSLFRPLPNTGDGDAGADGSPRGEESRSNSRSNDPEISQVATDRTKTLMKAPWSALGKNLSSFPSRQGENRNNPPRPTSGGKNWRIVSAVLFGMVHLSNHFPIDFSKYRIDGEIHLPCRGYKDYLLFSLFPKDFVLNPSNRIYCLSAMILVNASYQVLHCIRSTMILYGPLRDRDLDASGRGGIWAAIGAHAALNLNSTYARENLRVRILCRVLRYLGRNKAR